MSVADVRTALEKTMRATLADEQKYANWTYWAVRPDTPEAAYVTGRKTKSDCSKGVQRLCRWSGAPDPMNNGWADWGNSTTICSRLPHRARAADLEVGDPVTFGVDGDEHAAMVLETGPDPLVWSMGHHGAPNTYRLSQDPRPQQWLQLMPDPAPTPADNLRALTGYWPWVQWKLGEGSWRKYKPADKLVRPNVPKRIPLSWWRRYAKFVLNRKKANQPT